MTYEYLYIFLSIIIVTLISFLPFVLSYILNYQDPNIGWRKYASEKDEIQEKFRKVHKLKSNERKGEIQTRKRRP